MMRGGRRKGAGMKPGAKKKKLKASHKRRQVLTKFRLPQEWIDFLLSHKRKGSRMLEEALMAYYGKAFQAWKQADGEQAHEADTNRPSNFV